MPFRGHAERVNRKHLFYEYCLFFRLIDLVVGAPFFQSGADDELDFGGAAYVYTNTEQVKLNDTCSSTMHCNVFLFT